MCLLSCSASPGSQFVSEVTLLYVSSCLGSFLSFTLNWCLVESDCHAVFVITEQLARASFYKTLLLFFSPSKHSVSDCHVTLQTQWGHRSWFPPKTPPHTLCSTPALFHSLSGLLLFSLLSTALPDLVLTSAVRNFETFWRKSEAGSIFKSFYSPLCFVGIN